MEIMNFSNVPGNSYGYDIANR